MSFTIGSFNIQDFTGDGLYRKIGAPEYATPVARHIDTIADIILREQFDIVAIQEIRDAQALLLLKRRLPPNWECYCPEQTLDEPEYGFIWNMRTINLYHDADGNCIMPETIDRYGSGITKIKRDPYLGRFTPRFAPKVEIRLINIHLKSGGNSQTRGEFELVAGEIFERTNSMRDGNNMSVYTVVLGDYNLSAVYCNKWESTAPDIYITDTKQDKPTTITRDKTGYTNNDFDHFSLARNDERLPEGNIYVDCVDAVGKRYVNDFETYRKYISDHIPVKLEISLN